jgi:hypothetical protein
LSRIVRPTTRRSPSTSPQSPQRPTCQCVLELVLGRSARKRHRLSDGLEAIRVQEAYRKKPVELHAFRHKTHVSHATKLTSAPHPPPCTLSEPYFQALPIAYANLVVRAESTRLEVRTLSASLVLLYSLQHKEYRTMCKRTSSMQVEQDLAAFCRAQDCSSSLLGRLPAEGKT